MRALGCGAARAVRIEQVGRIGVLGVAERADADADQAKARAVDLARQQFAAGREDPAGKLGRIARASAARVRIGNPRS